MHSLSLQIAALRREKAEELNVNRQLNDALLAKAAELQRLAKRNGELDNEIENLRGALEVSGRQLQGRAAGLVGSGSSHQLLESGQEQSYVHAWRQYQPFKVTSFLLFLVCQGMRGIKEQLTTVQQELVEVKAERDAIAYHFQSRQVLVQTAGAKLQGWGWPCLASSLLCPLCLTAFNC